MKRFLKNVILAGVLCGMLGVSAATVSRVLVRQQWPWNAKVHVDYRLLNDAGESIEVTVAVTNGTREIVLPSRALTGPRMGALASGDYRLTIDPAKIDFAGADRLDDFKVTLSVKAAPADADLVLYRIYDLIARTRTDVSKAALLNGEWGDVETSYDFAKAGSFNPSEVVVWTGVTNNPAYKTNCLVMRYVPAGSFVMLPTTNAVNVELTKPYYIGVFEMTYAQCALISASRSKIAFSNVTYRAMRPMDSCTFDNIRGGNGRNWPVNKTVTGTSTYIYKVREITGENTFDLPTEARWEYAARAGATTRWNNGSTSQAAGLGNPACNILGRTKYTGGWIGDPSVGTSSYVEPTFDVDPEHGTAVVGSYLPNAWGLYDCHGNVGEWCVDRWEATIDLEGGTDPEGSDSANPNYRVVRGHSWYMGTTGHYIDLRAKGPNTDSLFDGLATGTLGFRLVCDAE